MSDIKLFRLTDATAVEAHFSSAAVEKDLQTLMDRHLSVFLGVRFLASEYSTGKTYGSVTAERREHALAEPFDDGILGPEVVQLRPGVVLRALLPRFLDGLRHPFRTCAQRVAVAIGLDFSWELTKALLQIHWRCDLDDLRVIVRGPLRERIVSRQRGERRLRELVVAGEQG